MEPDLEETDVIIVGAGPTGLALANYIGRFGNRAIVIERNSNTVAEPRAVSIDDESLRSMQALGLSRKIIERTIPGYGARYYAPGNREFARIMPRSEEFGHPKRSAFHQVDLEAILLRGLLRYPKVKVLFQHTLKQSSQNPDRVMVTVADQYGRERKMSCYFLAGCDGGRSTVRGFIGSELCGSSFEERWLVIDTINDDDDTKDSIAYCNHIRPAITLPGFGNTRRWEFLLKKGEDEDCFLKKEKIRSLLEPYIGLKPIEIIRKTIYSFEARVANKWGKGRIFILGDAAHLTPPYAGQGLNSGQRDVANFAWKVSGVIKGKLNNFIMDTYQTERRDHASALIQMATQLGWIMVPRNYLHTWGQAVFFRIAGLSQRFKEYIMGLKFKPIPRFEDGFLCPDGLPKKKTLVGRLMPQPLVRRLDGLEVKLDDLLGSDFSYVALGLSPTTKLLYPYIPEVDNLGVKRVFLTIGSNKETMKNCIIAELPLRGFSHNLQYYKGKILLVRPDRYIAAAFSPGNIAEIQKIRRRLSRFFP